MTGLTEISDVIGYELAEGKKIPCDGELYYQGYNVMDLVDSISDRRFGFEETTHLLLVTFGQLPNKQQLLDFEGYPYKLTGTVRTVRPGCYYESTQCQYYECFAEKCADTVFI